MQRRIVLWILLATSRVYAQSIESSDNTALAEQLFNQGRELAKISDWAAACRNFEASLHYDPTLGTRLNLATCYEKLGKLASAWGHYRDAAELAGKAHDAKRRDYALRQAAALEPRLPKLTITPPIEPPADLSVTRDGVAVDAGVLGGAFYVDPGAHEIKAMAPGFKTVTVSITVVESAAETVMIPELPPKAPLAKPAPVMSSSPPHDAPPATANTVPGAATSQPTSAPISRTRKLVGLGLVAGGAAAVGAGLIVGVKARSTYGEARTLCGNDLACDTADFDRGQHLVSDARAGAQIATVVAAAGGAAIVTGIVVWLTAPKERRPDATRVVPIVNARDVALAVMGRF